MIAWLEGQLREKGPTRIVVDVSGVGYELLVSLQTFEQLPETGKTVSLYVRTIVREDAFLLYGFARPLERETFDLLLKANRVGPKLAQAILSGIDPARLLCALRDGDQKVLRGVPGVGAKMAERIGFELRDGARELSALRGEDDSGVPADAADASRDVHDQLLSALLNLGYPRQQAERVVDSAASEAGEGASLESLIRVALRRLAR
jgi:Holliday junction DNA helicase RuvA